MVTRAATNLLHVTLFYIVATVLAGIISAPLAAVASPIPPLLQSLQEMFLCFARFHILCLPLPLRWMSLSKGTSLLRLLYALRSSRKLFGCCCAPAGATVIIFTPLEQLSLYFWRRGRATCSFKSSCNCIPTCFTFGAPAAVDVFLGSLFPSLLELLSHELPSQFCCCCTFALTVIPASEKFRCS